jgi:hypothetical protein
MIIYVQFGFNKTDRFKNIFFYFSIRRSNILKPSPVVKNAHFVQKHHLMNIPAKLVINWFGGF